MSCFFVLSQRIVGITILSRDPFSSSRGLKKYCNTFFPGNDHVIIGGRLRVGWVANPILLLSCFLCFSIGQAFLFRRTGGGLTKRRSPDGLELGQVVLSFFSGRVQFKAAQRMSPLKTKKGHHCQFCTFHPPWRTCFSNKRLALSRLTHSRETAGNYRFHEAILKNENIRSTSIWVTSVCSSAIGKFLTLVSFFMQ